MDRRGVDLADQLARSLSRSARYPPTRGHRRPVIIVVGRPEPEERHRVAAALMPSLAADGTRVFSLVYGSGINDQDILDKFDALIAQYQPREVSFFGSSMGGDVVLSLAAHTQDLRADYRRTLIAASGTSAFDSSALDSAALDSATSEPPVLDSPALGIGGQPGNGQQPGNRSTQPGTRGRPVPAPAARDDRVGGAAATAGRLLLTAGRGRPARPARPALPSNYLARLIPR